MKINNPPPLYPSTQTDLKLTNVIGTVYQNTGKTPRIVEVSITLTPGTAYTIVCDATATPTVSIGGNNNPAAVVSQILSSTFVVLPRHYYKIINGGGGGSVSYWIELN